MGDAAKVLPRSGIATTYAGTRFRSRLEARWACFLDRLDVPWLYEPTDLAFYIPDFIIPFDDSRLLLEVKPDTDFDSLRDHVAKIERSGWRGDFVVVGSRLFTGAVGLYGTCDGPGFALDRAMPLHCISCDGVCLVAEGGDWRCKRCGESDDGSHVGWVEPETLESRWADAGNRVQWKPLAEVPK